jgi:hypothetical protein
MRVKDSRDAGAGVVLIAAALASAVAAPARGLNPCRNPGSFSPNASLIEFASNARTACGSLHATESLANTLDNFSSVATTPCDAHVLKQVLFEGYVIGSGSTFGAIIAALGASCCDSQEQAQCAASESLTRCHHQRRPSAHDSFANGGQWACTPSTMEPAAGTRQHLARRGCALDVHSNPTMSGIQSLHGTPPTSSPARGSHLSNAGRG